MPPQTLGEEAKGGAGHVHAGRVDKHAKPPVETDFLVENPSTRGFTTLSPQLRTVTSRLEKAHSRDTSPRTTPRVSYTLIGVLGREPHRSFKEGMFVRIRNRMVGAATGVALTAGVLLAATAVPAQAYSPNPSYVVDAYSTSFCPCSNSDNFGGTIFAEQAGGIAVKFQLWDYDTGSYIGKTEFHPYGDKIKVFDTKNDGDSIYTSVEWWDSGVLHSRTYLPPGTSAVVDSTSESLDIPEGTRVDIYLWDNAGNNDLIAHDWGVA
jgi:hypothetical protein